MPRTTLAVPMINDYINKPITLIITGENDSPKMGNTFYGAINVKIIDHHNHEHACSEKRLKELRESLYAFQRKGGLTPAANEALQALQVIRDGFNYNGDSVWLANEGAVPKDVAPSAEHRRMQRMYLPESKRARADTPPPTYEEAIKGNY